MENATVLDAAAITQLLANARNRGGHEENIKSFVESGAMYRDLSELYPGKDAAQLKALKNTLTMKAKALSLPNVKVLKVDDENFIIVNTEALVEAETNEDQ